MHSFRAGLSALLNFLFTLKHHDFTEILSLNCFRVYRRHAGSVVFGAARVDVVLCRGNSRLGGTVMNYSRSGTTKPEHDA